SPAPRAWAAGPCAPAPRSLCAGSRRSPSPRRRGGRGRGRWCGARAAARRRRPPAGQRSRSARGSSGARGGGGHEDIGPAIVGRVEGQARGLLGRRAGVPQVDLVVVDVVVVAALGGGPDQKFSIAGQLGEVLVRAPAR